MENTDPGDSYRNICIGSEPPSICLIRHFSKKNMTTLSWKTKLPIKLSFVQKRSPIILSNKQIFSKKRNCQIINSHFFVLSFSHWQKFNLVLLNRESYQTESTIQISCTFFYQNQFFLPNLFYTNLSLFLHQFFSKKSFSKF